MGQRVALSALATATVFGVLGCGASHRHTVRHVEATRSCGVLGVGIGWQVSASSTLSCRLARSVARGAVGGVPTKAVFGYVCTNGQAGGRTRCVRGGRVVIAVPNN
jgi:hypothetical protein